MPCFVVKFTSLFGLHGKGVEGIRSLDASPRLDLMEQLSASMNELENWLHDTLAVVPLLEGPSGATCISDVARPKHLQISITGARG